MILPIFIFFQGCGITATTRDTQITTQVLQAYKRILKQESITKSLPWLIIFLSFLAISSTGCISDISCGILRAGKMTCRVLTWATFVMATGLPAFLFLTMPALVIRANCLRP